MSDFDLTLEFFLLQGSTKLRDRFIAVKQEIDRRISVV